MKLILAIGLFFVTAGEAVATSHYYPTTHLQKIESSKVRGEELKAVLFDVLIKKHVRQKKGNDVVVNNCGEAKGNCYGQLSLGYRGAR